MLNLLTDDLQRAPESDVAKAGVERQAREVEEAQGCNAVADADEHARVEFADPQMRRRPELPAFVLSSLTV